MSVELIEGGDICEVSADEFFRAFKKAQTINPNYVYVTLHPLEHYKDCKVRLLLIDKTAGLAIEEDGNIISVFKVGERKKVMNTMIPYAIEKYRGTKLDCFDGRLRVLYSQLGFVPICKTKFNPQFKPDGWDIEVNGMPDIIFWIYNQFMPSDYKIADFADIPLFDSYDAAMEYRNSVLNSCAIVKIK